MEEDNYHVKYGKHHDALTKLFTHLYNKEILVDCTLAAQEEHKYIQAHRIVLMACSPYLQNVLSNYSYDHYPVLNIDVKFAALESIVKFCYRGEVTVSQKDFDDFMDAANMLQIRGIAKDDKESEEIDQTTTEHPDADHHSILDEDGDGQDSTDNTLNSDDSSMDVDISNFEEMRSFNGNTGAGLIFPWTCSRCGEAFAIRRSYEQHRKLCSVVKNQPWKCDQCPSTYKNRKDLSRHKKNCGKDLPRHVCKNCGSTYKYSRGLQRHLKYCGKELEPYRCPDCDKTFKYMIGLKRHQKRCGILEALSKLAEKGVTPVLIKNKEEMREPPPPPPQRPQEPKQESNLSSEEGDSECKKCGKVYKYKRSLQRHEEFCVFVKTPDVSKEN